MRLVARIVVILVIMLGVSYLDAQQRPTSKTSRNAVPVPSFRRLSMKDYVVGLAFCRGGETEQETLQRTGATYAYPANYFGPSTIDGVTKRDTIGLAIIDGEQVRQHVPRGTRPLIWISNESEQAERYSSFYQFTKAGPSEFGFAADDRTPNYSRNYATWRAFFWLTEENGSTTWSIVVRYRSEAGCYKSAEGLGWDKETPLTFLDGGSSLDPNAKLPLRIVFIPKKTFEERKPQLMVRK